MLFELNKIYVLVICLVLGFSAQAQQEILGLWHNGDSTTVIEIYEDKGLYNGKIIWLKDTLTQGGLDAYNNNNTLRNRRLIGIDLIYGFQWMENFWRKGKVYDYKSGRTYNGKIVVKNNHLKLSGFYGILFFLGKTKTWYKVA